MAKPVKPKTMVVIDEEGQKQVVSETGIPGLFQPQQCDIEEEFQGNEALREYQRNNNTDEQDN